ncbi:MAG: I78 family peptidase inhibitor [Sphingopyxis sp.]|uniref:I78 family peptidase inhibitor n=1 Tax=Sphingopyxis sp. TaxID=1908224 RepID=UPI002AB9601D|nr:I78 family peptidase inhibitor [Sphingopyxis sp.]MDZ3831817.1 I78 family peptidase inhibitor [Sphingopyxis sp.]
MDIRWIFAATALPLAACAGGYGAAEPETPSAPAEMTCNADVVQSHVGHRASPEMGAAILKESGARTLRWGPPRSAMTMDYRQDRVNVMYDDAYTITQVSCG